MSQNTHTLILVYKNDEKHIDCVSMLRDVELFDDIESETWVSLLGVDISSYWGEDWFNCSVVAKPEFIRIDYDTGSGSVVPLEVLRQLFSNGLKLAVLDTFHDQVGEYSRHHFLNGKLVDQGELYQAFPKMRNIVESEIQSEEVEDYSVSVAEPVSLSDLIDKEKKQSFDAEAMVAGLIEIAKISKETGKDPTEIIKSVYVRRAMRRGLLQAVIFACVTVLLFKGIWLWVGIGVMLALILPLYYVSQVNKDFEDEEGEEGGVSNVD